MGEIISTIFSSFNEVIQGLANGIQSSFTALLFKGVETNGVMTYASANGLSDFGKFGFIMLGLGLATGLVYGAVRLIRR